VRALSPVHTSNNVEETFDFAVVFSNNVERVFREISSFRLSGNKLNMFNLFRLCRKKVERIVRLVAFDNVAWTLLLVETTQLTLVRLPFTSCFGLRYQRQCVKKAVHGLQRRSRLFLVGEQCPSRQLSGAACMQCMHTTIERAWQAQLSSVQLVRPSVRPVRCG